MPDQRHAISYLPSCDIRTYWRESTVIINCAGELEMLTAPELKRRVARALKDGPSSMIVDLTALSFLAAHGMRVLVESHDLCVGSVRFAVVACGRRTLRPIQLTGLAELISIHDTLERALEVVAPQPSRQGGQTQDASS